MNLLNKLTFSNLKLNKKRSIVTIIGILLSAALITAVASMYSSFLDSSIIYEKSQKGNYHLKLKDVPLTEIDTLKNNSKIESIKIKQGIGYIELKDSKNEYKPYGYIMAYDNDSLKDTEKDLIEGRLPKNSREILISESLKSNAKINTKVGDIITLNIGKRIQDGYELDQSNPYNKDEIEEFVGEYETTYTVVGIVKRPVTIVEPYDAPGYTYITCYEENNRFKPSDVYILFNSKGVKNSYTVTANILGVDPELYKEYKTVDVPLSTEKLEKIDNELKKAKYDSVTNDYLIKLETNPLSISANKSLGVIVAVVCCIIIFTSVFCIKNSFDISITEKIKQYGMLKSVGATKKQIKKNVLFEAMLLGLVGIPLGLICGLIAAFILVKITNVLLFKSFADGLIIYFSVRIEYILISILLGIITIYFSAIRSAKKASKVSSIELIRNSGNIKIKSKKLKTPKIIDKAFGIGGVLSFKNLKRNKRKYRTTIITLTISIATFIGLFYFTSNIYRSIEKEFLKSEYNYSYLASDYSNIKDKVEQTTKIDGIEEFSINRFHSFELKNPKINKDYMKDNLYSGDSIDINITSVGDVEYKKFIKKLGLDINDTKNKAILIDTLKTNDNKKVQFFDYKPGDVIDGIIDTNNVKLEIVKVTDIAPFALSGDDISTLIVTDDMFEKINTSQNHVNVYIYAKDAYKVDEEVKEILKDNLKNTNNVLEEKKQIENLLLLVSIFLYGFITVITLIGITNVYNTITTNIELRKQEFAMLKSIGMTKKEFRKMINLESLFMGGKSLIYGSLIGSAIAYLIFKLNIETVPEFKYPFDAILICIVVVMLLINSLMRYSVRKINKQNIIETIRNENI